MPVASKRPKRGNPMNCRQIEEAHVMRAEGMTWRAIAEHFQRTPTQVRHYMGVLVTSRARQPRKPRVYPPRPQKGTPEYERVRRADIVRTNRYRAKILQLTGMRGGKYRAVIAALREEAEMTGRPMGRLRLEQGLPSLTQLKLICSRLSLPTLEAAMSTVTEDLERLLDEIPELV